MKSLKDSDTVTISAKVNLTIGELKTLAYRARGFVREDGRKAWSLNEYKEAARVRLEQLAQDDIEKAKP